MRPKAGHSMMQSGRSAHAAAVPSALSSAARSAWASATTRVWVQVARSNIRPELSRQRSESEPLRPHAKNNAARLVDRYVNADAKPKPGVPLIQKFSKLGSVGVLKPCCTIADDHTRALDGTTPDQAYFTPLPLRTAA